MEASSQMFHLGTYMALFPEDLCTDVLPTTPVEEDMPRPITGDSEQPANLGLVGGGGGERSTRALFPLALSTAYFCRTTTFLSTLAGGRCPPDG